jgi:DNA-binding NarL/FixJ family response regulator
MKVLVVDDHAVVREGIAALLRTSTIVPEVLQAGNAAAAFAIATAHPDLDAILLDLRLPGESADDILRRLGEQHPTLPVLILSSSEDPHDVRRALALGALGYVTKSASPATLLAALNLVLSGETYVPPFMVRSGAPGGPSASRLTGRQSEVLELVGADLSNKQIAHRLGLSEKTVKAHVTAILRTLGVTSRSQARRMLRPD